MSYIESVTDRTSLSRCTYIDINRISSNINYLLGADSPAEDFIIGLDADAGSRTYQHLLMQRPSDSHLEFYLEEGSLQLEATDGKTISAITEVAEDDEGIEYLVTFTDSTTETFFIQNEFYGYTATIKDDFSQDDIVTLSQWRDIVRSIGVCCLRYGVKMVTPVDESATYSNLNQAEQYLDLCNTILDKRRELRIGTLKVGVSGASVNAPNLQLKGVS